MSRGKRSLFFFNPFTNQHINLPDLPIISNDEGDDLDHYLFECISFSSSPTSPDCIVFGWYACYILLYISPGENSWNVCELRKDTVLLEAGVNLNFKLMGGQTSPVFHNRAFYLVGDNGTLGVFKPKDGLLWEVLDRLQEPKLDYVVDEIYIMECDGKILSVFVGVVGRGVSVFELNETEMCWKKVEDLEDYMLFVSHTTSFALKKLVDGMENKVYFSRRTGSEDRLVYYSLETNKFESFGGTWSREDLFGTKYNMNSGWVVPRIGKDLEWIKSQLKRSHTRANYYHD